MDVAGGSTRDTKFESSQELNELHEYGIVSLTVPSKYTGTAADKDMQILGKVQVLRLSGDTELCYK